MRDILEMHGYTVFPTRDAAAALREFDARNGEIDMVLTDVVMPGMSGWSLAKSLRALQPNLKILFVSGYTDVGVVDNELLKATDAFLQKPISVDALMRKVREVLDGNRHPGVVDGD